MKPVHSNAIDLIPMGQFYKTFYCPCYECSEGYGRKTASQTCAESGRTVAVDTDVINLGSRLLIDGEEYVAEDTGGRVVGDHVDIFVDTHDETIECGTGHCDVKIIRKTK
jgi:3D (Asp-Asp-Asp) domain-containing protein